MAGKRKKDEEEDEEELLTEEEEEKPKKKKKAAPKSEAKKSAKKNDEGGGDEPFVDLGNNRRVTVRKFKGRPLIDIREFYEQNGELKPGRKGIALSPDLWDALKKGITEIDELVAKIS